MDLGFANLSLEDVSSTIINEPFFLLFSEQILTNKITNELLLCIAYVLEVAQEGHSAQHHIYRLTR